MKNIIYLFIVVLLTMNSCVAYKEAWLNPKEKPNSIIPNLSVLIDRNTVHEELSGIAYSDGVTLLNNYFINNIVDSIGHSRGTLEITINKNYHKITNIGCFVLSTLTVYTINLIGFPMLSQKVSITVNAKIRSLKGDAIKEYSEEGIGSAFSAIYWGYSWYGALTKSEDCVLPRTVNTLAMADALKKIKNAVTRDSKEINRRLYE